MIKECLHCNSLNLKAIKNYEYQMEDNPIELINGLICAECDCIHSIKDNILMFHEYSIGYIKESNAVSNWATNQNMCKV
jgi:hypothetical protein